MAITYTWKINNLEIVDQGNLKDVAIHSFFEVYGENDEGQKGFEQGDVKLMPVDPKSFTDIKNVSHEQAIVWTKNALTDDGKYFEDKIFQQIEWQKAPKSKLADLDWVSSTGAENE